MSDAPPQVLGLDGDLHLALGVGVEDHGDLDASPLGDGVRRLLEGDGHLGRVRHGGVEVAAAVAEPVGVPGLDPVDVALSRHDVGVDVGGGVGAGVVDVGLEVVAVVDGGVAASDLVAGDGVVAGVVPGEGDAVVGDVAGQAGGLGRRVGLLGRQWGRPAVTSMRAQMPSMARARTAPAYSWASSDCVLVLMVGMVACPSAAVTRRR